VRTRHDLVLVGAGILGLATARELRRRNPELSVAVVDKEPGPGRHQSSHNSGVLHAGVYYQPGSLKAQLCVRGKALMEEYAAAHGIAVDRCGKLVVALTAEELPRLEELARRAAVNGVAGARLVGAAEMREVEPHAAGIRALHVPETAIIDFALVVGALAEEVAADGVELVYGAEVVGLQRLGVGGDTVVQTTAGELSAGAVVSCAGLHSDRVARLSGPVETMIVPFRGDYYTLAPSASHLCRGLIYPVPDPALPFLGVHFTRRVDGEVWAGPNAVLATAREGYRRSTWRGADLRETVTFPGFRRLARRWWRTGMHEMVRDAVKPAFVRELQRYVPEVRSDQLTFGPSGVRAQAVSLDGGLVDDFLLLRQGRSVHVLNAPSPAATASLAIAERIADAVEPALLP
jgi:L-2-hydroxyglutarate oxidase LhgO